MLETSKKLVQYPCPCCHSNQSYHRIKTKERVCRNCGEVWTPILIDTSKLSDQAEKDKPTRKKA